MNKLNIILLLGHLSCTHAHVNNNNHHGYLGLGSYCAFAWCWNREYYQRQPQTRRGQLGKCRQDPKYIQPISVVKILIKWIFYHFSGIIINVAWRYKLLQGNILPFHKQQCVTNGNCRKSGANWLKILFANQNQYFFGEFNSILGS